MEEQHFDLNNIEIADSGILNLSKRAGVKKLSENCYDIIKKILVKQLEEVIKNTIIANNEHASKTIMPEDVCSALKLMDVNPIADF